MNVDHLQIGQAVDASHAESHDAKYERKTRQRFAHRYEHHADWHNRCVDQQYVIRINSKKTCYMLLANNA